MPVPINIPRKIPANIASNIVKKVARALKGLGGTKVMEIITRRIEAVDITDSDMESGNTMICAEAPSSSSQMVFSIEKDIKLSFTFNFGFSRRLNTLVFMEKETQYQLAYLSTLGGAYHLTNDPDKALMIAHRQEQIGQRLGSSVIIIRSWVFQAVNFGMKGQINACKKMLAQCKAAATAHKWNNMMEFVNTSEMWLKMNDHIP